MNYWRIFVATGAMAVMAVGIAGASSPAGKQWDSRIILRGAERAAVKSMPIEARPNRPLHFYGNTIRRMDQRNK